MYNTIFSKLYNGEIIKWIKMFSRTYSVNLKNKGGIRNKTWYKKKTSKMTAVNSTIPIITLNVSGLNHLIKGTYCKLDQKTRSNYILSTGDTH